MGCLVQEVVGRPYRDYFLPALSGVAFSQNGYCWNKEIHKKDGLVRLVMGSAPGRSGGATSGSSPP